MEWHASWSSFRMALVIVPRHPNIYWEGTPKDPSFSRGSWTSREWSWWDVSHCKLHTQRPPMELCQEEPSPSLIRPAEDPDGEPWGEKTEVFQLKATCWLWFQRAHWGTQRFFKKICCFADRVWQVGCVQCVFLVLSEVSEWSKKALEWNFHLFCASSRRSWASWSLANHISSKRNPKPCKKHTYPIYLIRHDMIGHVKSQNSGACSVP